MRWGSGVKHPTFHFNCVLCKDPKDPLYPLHFIALHTPATCKGCGTQYHHVLDTQKGSSPVLGEAVEQLHLS